MKYLTIILILLGLSTQAQDTTFHRSLQYSYIALNMADYVLTQDGLKRGAVEANPLLRNANSLEMAAVKIVATGIVIYLSNKMDRKAAKWVLIGMNIVYSAIVINNYRVWQLMR